MSKYIQSDLAAALAERESGLAQVRSLADQLGASRRSYETALENFDVETASAAWAQIQVLQAMVERANAAVRHISPSDAVRSISTATGDLSMARRELEAAARGADASSFADAQVRQALKHGLPAPGYAEKAADAVAAFVLGTRSALQDVDGWLMRLNSLKPEQLDNIESLLLQSERAADRARDLVGQAQGVKAEIAAANAAYMGVTA